MGEDMNIVTLSFSTKTDETAKDLVNFLEKGYSSSYSGFKAKLVNNQTVHIKYL